jgi:hypothetical protein
MEHCGIDMTRKYNISAYLAVAGIVIAVCVPPVLSKLGLALQLAQAIGICGGMILLLLAIQKRGLNKKTISYLSIVVIIACVVGYLLSRWIA